MDADPHPPISTPWTTIGIPVVAIVVCLLIRKLFEPWLGLSVPYLFFFPTVMVAALYGGYRTGIVTTVLAMILATYLYLPPIHSFRIEATADLVSWPLFGAIGWAISWVAESRRQFERDSYDAAAVALRHAQDVEAATRRLNDIVANVPGVVWEAWGEPDAATQRIDFVSDYARTMLGYQPAEWVAAPNFWLTIVHPDDRERAAHEAHAIFTGKGTGRSEFRWVHRDGRAVWVEAHSTVIRDGAGRPVGMRGVTLDISERKRLEQDLADLLQRERHAREEAVTANRHKDDFLATLSHELRTPLNAVLGYAHMLRVGAVDRAQQDHALEVVERNANALAHLVSDVLDVSRIATGRIRLNLQIVDVRTVLDDAITTVKPAADAKGVRLEIEADPDIPFVSADPDRLQQVIWNLLANAVRFTPRNGRIVAAVRLALPDVAIEVKDDGIGIPPEFLPHVFDRFRQADSQVTREHGGLGLGLAISKDLIELHGGTIRAASAGPGQGASFRVLLPCVPAA